MKLLFLSSVYLFYQFSSFPMLYWCSFHASSGGGIVELIIFTIGTCWFNIATIIKSLVILIRDWRY